jgi:hypothetical protein
MRAFKLGDKGEHPGHLLMYLVSRQVELNMKCQSFALTPSPSPKTGRGEPILAPCSQFWEQGVIG